MDEEHLYTAYDDDDDDEGGGDGRDALHLVLGTATSQYSRSVTPDYGPQSADHISRPLDQQTPPQPLLGGLAANNAGTVDLGDNLKASPKGKRKKRTNSGATMDSVRSESPRSPSPYETIEQL